MISLYSCKCGYFVSTIPCISWGFPGGSVGKESSCKEEGVITFTCNVCKDSYTETIALSAHKFGTAAVTKEPTCTSEGEKSKTCAVCQLSEVVEKLPKVAHSYKSKVKIAATCTDKGVNTLTCSVCSASKEESVKALGHDYKQSNIITKVTCTSDGEVTMTCSRCNDSYNEIKKATGHKWVEATCTKAKHCQNCKLEEGEALGHNYISGTCSRCKKGTTVTLKNKLPFKDRNSYSKSDLSITKVKFGIKSNYADGGIGIVVYLTGTLTNHDGSTALNGHTIRLRLYDTEGNCLAYKFFTFEEYGGTTATKDVLFATYPVGDYVVELSVI